MHREFTLFLGTPHRKGPRRRPVADRFWPHVDKNGPIIRTELGPCWVWTAKKGWGGYGAFYISGAYHAAHRVSFVLNGGIIPDELLVLHTCDFRSCVRPSHLFLGTNADNARDKEAKGRGNQSGPLSPPRGDGHWSRLHPEKRAVGERHGRARLTEDQVIEIIRRSKAGEQAKRLAAELGVSRPTVSQIIEGRTWRYLPRQ